MRYLSLFSGIEAASVAWAPPGWECAAVAEVEPFPCAVLKHHYPDVPNLGDVAKVTKEQIRVLGKIGIVVGGSPCQAFSVAGLRRSLDDARGNLALRYVQICDWATECNPDALVLWENVPGVLSTKDNAFGCFLGALVGADTALQPGGRGKWGNAGLVAGPRLCAAWRILDAQYFGVPQRRRRVFVLAARHLGAADLAEILLEPESLRGNPAPSRKPREDVAPCRAARTRGGGGLGTDFDCDGGLIAGTLNANGKAAGSATQQDAESGLLAVAHTMVFDPVQISGDSPKSGKARKDVAGGAGLGAASGGEIAHALTANWCASEDGTGRGTPLVSIDYTNGLCGGDVSGTIEAAQSKGNRTGGDHPPGTDVDTCDSLIAFSSKDFGADSGELAPTLRACGHTSSHANAGAPPVIAFHATQDPISSEHHTPALSQGCAQGCASVAICEPMPFDMMQVTSKTNRSQPAPGREAHTLSRGNAAAAAVAFQLNGDRDNPGVSVSEGTAFPLRADDGSGNRQVFAPTSMCVRRLTTVECARLMGFPDHYLDIIFEGKPAKDGCKYKALGNSMAVPVMAWIGRRIAEGLGLEVPAIPYKLEDDEMFT